MEYKKFYLLMFNVFFFIFLILGMLVNSFKDYGYMKFISFKFFIVKG